jgi:hypothetical protein
MLEGRSSPEDKKTTWGGLPHPLTVLLWTAAIITAIVVAAKYVGAHEPMTYPW